MQNRNQRPAPQRNNNFKASSTSWGPVAPWYDEYLQDEDTYQAKVILPNLMRVLGITDMKDGTKVLELGCGQGYFMKEILKLANPKLTGVDISAELLEIAKKNIGHTAELYQANAAKLPQNDHSVDKIYSVLALQNMSDLDGVTKEVKRVLKPKGQGVIVLNHPAFRIPKESDWHFSAERKSQGRVVYTYMTDKKFAIDMHPGLRAAGLKTEETFSFHHPLQVYAKLFAKHGLCITRLEEWISHKQSEEGPKKRAEDEARKEIPMFMCLEIKPFLD